MLPVIRSFKRGFGGKRLAKWLIVPVGAAIFAMPASSQAAGFERGRDDRRDGYNWQDRNWRDRDNYRRDNDKRVDIGVNIRIGEPRPEYRVRETRVWVPAVYRTVVDRRWVEPVYRTECERVWIPACYEEREIRTIGYGRGRTRIERVLIEPGHYENRDRQILVCDGHWENVERQELVCAGHYETHTERVRVPYRESPLAVVNPMLGGAVHLGR